MQRHPTRRTFMGGAMLAVLAAGIPPLAGAQSSTLKTRENWKTFRKGRHYASFIDALRKMRANPTAGDPRSRAYWAQIHHVWCTHHVPYFLAWHRGYVALFERQLRAVSGDPGLTLPYWDYYEDPNLPPEFTDPSPWNPLYMDRVNNNVAGALTYDPFAASVTTFQGGATAFEQMLENAPHDPVHDLIGGLMSGMDSPLDPIFWLHHANIDRLYSAWVAAAAGRAVPPSADAYWDGTKVAGGSINWQGQFKYSDSSTLPARFNLAPRSTIDSRTSLGYFFDNEQLPVAPAAVTAQRTAGVQQPAPALETGTFAISGRRQTGRNRLGLGGVLDVPLGKRSVGARVQLDRAAQQSLKGVLDSYRKSPFVGAAAAGGGQQYTTVKVVLSNVTVTDVGTQGGYFFNLKLDLPSANGKGDEAYSFGSVGPFRVAGLQHHGHNTMAVDVEFDITDLMLKHGKPDLGNHKFQLNRINGKHTPDGDVLRIGEIRLELS